MNPAWARACYLALLGASLGLLITSTVSPAALASWGWRIPFVIGLLIAPVGLYVRLRLRDEPTFTNSARHAGTPLAQLCRAHGRRTLMIMGQTIPVYAIVYFMPSYATRVMHMPAITGFMASALSALLLVCVQCCAIRQHRSIHCDRFDQMERQSLVCGLACRARVLRELLRADVFQGAVRRTMNLAHRESTPVSATAAACQRAPENPVAPCRTRAGRRV
ncbi:MFS transporter [Paraburkholderia sp. J7]|uniref:MFS transporter n=1 Tax=Paraburkholderia sp. J7 TaxID=2805438 RepID=UPI002AB6A164|nr:MFS transporter [Paraburkholderia sp. J7]